MEWLVGACWLVTEDAAFEDGMLILGQPASMLKLLNEKQQGLLKASSAIYVANYKRFASSLTKKISPLCARLRACATTCGARGYRLRGRN